MTAPRPLVPSLWRNRSFMLLWMGQAVNDLGSSVTTVALPLVAVTVLDATAFEVGLLTALGTLGWLMVALPAGVVVDRTRKRWLMVLCDVCRAVLLASVPGAALFGNLTVWHLYVVGLGLGVFAVFSEVACQSYVPSLVSREQLVKGTGRIGTTNALASVLGPSLAGALSSVLNSVTRVLLVDCLSYVVSVVTLLLIRSSEPSPEGRPVRSGLATVVSGIAEGLRFVMGHWVLRRIVACSATANMFDTMVVALIVVFLARDLGAEPAVIGVVLAFGGAGGVVGGLAAEPLARWLGHGRALWASKLVLGALSLCIPAAGPGWGVYLVSVGLFVSGVVTVSYNVLQIAYRQSICPQDLRGRMNASVRWVIRGLMPVGGLAAGALATAIGVRSTLAVAVIGSWLAAMWIFLSPLRRLRELPGPEPMAQESSGSRLPSAHPEGLSS